MADKPLHGKNVRTRRDRQGRTRIPQVLGHHSGDADVRCGRVELLSILKVGHVAAVASGEQQGVGARSPCQCFRDSDRNCGTGTQRVRCVFVVSSTKPLPATLVTDARTVMVSFFMSLARNAIASPNLSPQ